MNIQNPFQSKPFREKIGLSKYARWAKDLTEDQLLTLLEVVGEYGCRSEKVLDILRRRSPKKDYSCTRAIVALEILAEFSHGNPLNEEALTERIRQVPNPATAMLLSKLGRMER